MYFPKDGWSFTFDLDGNILSEVIFSEKPDNNVPKSIKGDYDLSIHGNKIVLVDNVDGTTVEAKCHPDDNFDIGIGIKEAFKKLNERREELRKQKEEEEKKIKVGDWIEVVNNGWSYPTSAYVFEENDILHYAARFRYGVTPLNGMKGRVMFITDNNIAVVEEQMGSYYGDSKFSSLKCYNAIYLINLQGLRKVAKPNV